MESRQKILDIIHHATGTEAYYAIAPDYPLVTDGAISLASAVACYWLLDAIGAHQANKKLDPMFQVWTLTVDLEAASGVLRGFNDVELIVEQKIVYTDFPLEKVTLYVENGIMLLPNEH